MTTSTDGRLRGLAQGRHPPIARLPQAALLAALLQLLPRVAASSSSSSSSLPAVFPYTPTSILVPGTNPTIIYVFSPSASGQVDFLSLNISSTLSASSTSSITTLTQGVPFLANSGQENTASTFTPSIRYDGSIFVFAGDCSSSSADGATVWTYAPSTSSSAAAQWTSSTISLSSSQSGPWFLGSSTAFSNQIAPTMSNSTFYIYGGMCPTNGSSSSSTSTTTTAAASSTSITASNWQGLASYSNQMLKLVPSSNTYTPSIVPSKGPPIAEAGFTFTALAASQSNLSGIVTQQVNSVVLGGHTETAFVNMSTAAIWSLPEEAWSFVSIANPSSSSSSNTELAVVRKADSSTTSAPDSRSGHTAVLSADGNSLVVLGGWVGDVGQAADPQLAVLEMGPDYGQWQWSIPSSQPSGSGIYGHGAALLPGNVMMVYGGYNISSAASSTKLIRRQSSSTGSGLMFFNLTSLAWSEDYTNPTYDTSSASSAAPKDSSSSTTSTKIGLGIGLGLGIPLAILALVLLIRACRHRSRQRRRRNEAVRALAQDHHQFLHGHDEMVERGSGAGLPAHWSPRDALGFYAGGHDPYNSGRRSLGFESLRGTKSSPAFPSFQSPNVGSGSDSIPPGSAFANVRKPSRNVARGLYQPTTINDYESSLTMSGAAGGAAAGSGTNSNGIHPIYEADEEDEDGGTETEGRPRPATVGTADESTGRSISPETEELTDPFLTPSTQSLIGGGGGGGSIGGPMRSAYAGAFGPNTVNLNPFVRNTPSPEAGGALSRLSRGGMTAGDIGGAEAAGAGTAPGAAPATALGQDRDVQEWVSGLEIEDLLFAPPVPGATAAVAASVSPFPGQMGPANTGHRLSLRSKTSSVGSPTRSSFFGGGPAAAAAAVAGAVAGVTGGWGSAGDDEARTGSNLSDRSAFSFLSRTASSRSRMGGVSGHGGHGGYGPIGIDPKASSSDSSSASYNTAPSGFHNLRAEGPALLYGKSHKNGSSAGGSFGASSGTGGAGNSSTSAGASVTSSVRGGAISPTGYALHPPPALPSQAHAPNSGFEYGGAASVMASGIGALPAAAYAFDANRGQRNQRNVVDEDENENTALTGPPGSPSKFKGRRTWMGSLMRIFSGGSSSSPNAGHPDASLDDTAGNNTMGTGAQQGPNYRDMAHATLLRRKQGRSDWEADELREEESTAVGALRSGGRTASISSLHGYSHSIGHSIGHGGGPGVAGGGGGLPATSGTAPSGSVAAGRRDGSDEWDVEKAVQSRVVQVMFTMPRDQRLRVVNAEVEDDADIASLSSMMDPHNDHLGGGLAAPPPPPVLQRPYQSYRSLSPIPTTNSAAAAAAAAANEQYRAMPPPADRASSPPPPGDFLDKHDEQLRQLHEALAESKRLLSGKAIEPWMLDAHDDDDDEVDGADDDDVTFGEEEVHEDEAQAIPLNKGKVVDVGWMLDAGGGSSSSSIPAPLRPSTPERRPERIKNERTERANYERIKDERTREEPTNDEQTLATAAALARVLLSRGPAAAAPTKAPAMSAAAPTTAAPATTPTQARMSSKAPPSATATPERAKAAPVATPTKAPAQTGTINTAPSAATPTKALTPMRSLASLRTPTKAPSADSLSTNASATSSLTPRRSAGRRGTLGTPGTLGGDTLLGSSSPAAAQAAGVIRKKASGFVLDMVDKIETGSPKAGSPVRA